MREQFPELVRRYKCKLKKTIARYAPRGIREDCYQKTILISYEKLHQLRNPQFFGAWAAKIAKNRCHADGRSTSKREHFEMHFEAEPPDVGSQSSYGKVLTRVVRPIVAQSIQARAQILRATLGKKGHYVDIVMDELDRKSDGALSLILGEAA